MIKLYADRFVGTAIDRPAQALMPDTMRDGRAWADARRDAWFLKAQPRYGKQPPARWLEPEGYAAMFADGRPDRPGSSLLVLIDPDGFSEASTRMCRRFPDTTVIIDHLGRIGAGPDGAIRDADVEALRALAKHRKLYVKVGAFYALGKKKPPYLDLAPLIRSVIEAFGAGRCLWESDCPFQVVKDRYLDSLALIRDGLGFLSPDDRDWLLFRTSEQILFRPLTLQ